MRPFIILALSATLASTATAQQRYRLTPEAEYMKGCFAPCACPISIAPALRGTFILTERPVGDRPTDPRPTDADRHQSFTVSGLHIRAALDRETHDRPLRIQGEGVYSIAQSQRPNDLHPRQRLVLNLSTNGGEPETFDSDLVLGGARFPELLDVSLSIHGYYCLDTALTIVARPVSNRLSDLNADNTVNARDLAQLLSSWDTDDVNCDITFDGQVNAADLATMLSEWGAGE